MMKSVTPPHSSSDILRLPAANAAVEDPFARLRANAASGPQDEEAPESVIMMVDDEPINIEVLQTFLQDAGYKKFVSTSDPLKAMDLMAAHRPDVVLLDIVMPAMSGFEILKRMRNIELLRLRPARGGRTLV